MKKRVLKKAVLSNKFLLTSLLFLLIISIFLININFISAVEIKFSKETYQPQETLQAEITGNFISLAADNVFIYKQGKAHPEPVIKDLTKQNNIYYFYAVLPKEPGNYSFVIDSQHLERGNVKEEPIRKDLFLEFKNISDLSFNPGFAVPDKEISIKVKSLLGNIKLKAVFELTQETKEIELVEQKEEIVKFKLPALSPQQSKIIINSYEIPVFLIKKINISEDKLEFIPYQITGVIISENKYPFTALIRNLGSQKIENISLTSDLNVSFNPSFIKILGARNTTIVNMTIFIGKPEKEKIDGRIIAKTEKESFYLPIFFNITTNKSDVKVSESKSLSCSELGNICKENEICSGEIVGSLEGACCIGSCVEEEKSNLSSIIGIVLLIILTIIVIYIILKIRQRKKIKSAGEVLKERSDRFRKRMGGEENEEVYGKLDRV